MTPLDKINLPIKTVLGICLWIFTVAGGYYTIQSEVAAMKKEIAKYEKLFETYDIKIMNYKLSQVEATQKEINAKTDRIIRMLDVE